LEVSQGIFHVAQCFGRIHFVKILTKLGGQLFGRAWLSQLLPQKRGGMIEQAEFVVLGIEKHRLVFHRSLLNLGISTKKLSTSHCSPKSLLYKKGQYNAKIGLVNV
jgi:hypothetical protein